MPCALVGGTMSYASCPPGSAQEATGSEGGAEPGGGTRLLGVEYLRARTSRLDTRAAAAPSGRNRRCCVCVDSDLMAADEWPSASCHRPDRFSQTTRVTL